MTQKPNHRCLFEVASGQHGYFTSKQATACAISHDLVSHYTGNGKYLRIRRGLYRLRDYPTFPEKTFLPHGCRSQI